MSSSKRAAEKIDHAYCVGELDERPRERAEIAAIIDAEYAPLIESAKELISIFHAEDCGIPTCRMCALSRALAHIEGDATP